MANLVAANGQIDHAAEVRRFIPEWRARRELNSLTASLILVVEQRLIPSHQVLKWNGIAVSYCGNFFKIEGSSGTLRMICEVVVDSLGMFFPSTVMVIPAPFPVVRVNPGVFGTI